MLDRSVLTRTRTHLTHALFRVFPLRRQSVTVQVGRSKTAAEPLGTVRAYRSTPMITVSRMPSPKYATSTEISIIPIVGITLRSGVRNHSVRT